VKSESAKRKRVLTPLVDGSPPVMSTGEAPAQGLMDNVPQKLVVFCITKVAFMM